MNFKTRGISILFISGINVIINIIISIFVPTIINQIEFANWRVFILYSGFSGIIHLGIIDGILLKYLKSDIEYSKQNFLSHFIISHLLLIITISLLFLLVSAVPELSPIRNALIIQFYLQNLLLLTQTYIQSQKKFIFNSIVTFIPNFFFLSFLLIEKKLDDSSLINYFNISFFISVVFSIIYIMFKVPFKLKLNLFDVIYNQKLIKTFKSGFLILCSGLVIVGLKSFDRILIANYYSKIDFALYAFSYSLIVIFVMIFSSINNLLLKHFIESNMENKIKIEKNIYSISIFISLLIIASYFIIESLILYVLPQYIGSITYFKILSLSIVPTLLINLLQFNYFKIENKEKMFFMTSILFLIIAISLSYLFALASSSLSYQAYIKVGVFWGWYILNEWLIGNKLKYKRAYLKNKYLLLLLILFIQLLFVNIWN